MANVLLVLLIAGAVIVVTASTLFWFVGYRRGTR
jgi:hypothetical protein